MQFAPPLVEARLIKRYKRFLADMEVPGEFGGKSVTVHCPNPGSMMGLAEPGSRCWLMPRPAVSPGTKLPYGWEIVESRDATLEEIFLARAGRTRQAEVA